MSKNFYRPITVAILLVYTNLVLIETYFLVMGKFRNYGCLRRNSIVTVQNA